MNEWAPQRESARKKNQPIAFDGIRNVLKCFVALLNVALAEPTQRKFVRIVSDLHHSLFHGVHIADELDDFLHTRIQLTLHLLAVFITLTFSFHFINRGSVPFQESVLPRVSDEIIAAVPGILGLDGKLQKQQGRASHVSRHTK